ncbi:hypothetical protein L249_8616, partial [Ophiocordyceps polyrhachis-furcata BCC 54312]
MAFAFKAKGVREGFGFLGFSRSERKGMRAGQDLLPFLSCLLAMNLTVDLCSDLLLPLAFRDSPNGMRAGSDLTPFSCRPSNLPNQHGYRRDGDGLGAGTGFDPVSSGNSLHSSLLRLPFPSFRCNCQSNTVIAADSDELGAGIGFGPFSFCVFPLMTAADHFRSFNPSILSRHEQALATCDAVIAADSDGLGAGIGFAPFSSCVFPLMTAADHFRSFNPSILFKTPSNCDLRHGYRCGQRWAWGGLRIWPLFLFCHNRSRFSFLRKNLHLAIRLSLRTAMGMGRARICPFPPSASFLMMTADLFSRTSRRRLSTLKTFPPHASIISSFLSLNKFPILEVATSRQLGYRCGQRWAWGGHRICPPDKSILQLLAQDLSRDSGSSCNLKATCTVIAAASDGHGAGIGFDPCLLCLLLRTLTDLGYRTHPPSNFSSQDFFGPPFEESSCILESNSNGLLTDLGHRASFLDLNHIDSSNLSSQDLFLQFRQSNYTVIAAVSDGLGAGTGFDPISFVHARLDLMLCMSGLEGGFSILLFSCNLESNTVIAAVSDGHGAGTGFEPHCNLESNTVIAAVSDGHGAGTGFEPQSLLSSPASSVGLLMLCMSGLEGGFSILSFRTVSCNLESNNGYRCGKRLDLMLCMSGLVGGFPTFSRVYIFDFDLDSRETILYSSSSSSLLVAISSNAVIADGSDGHGAGQDLTPFSF